MPATGLLPLRTYIDDTLPISLGVPAQEGWQLAANADFALLVMGPREDGFTPNIGFRMESLDAPTPQRLAIEFQSTIREASDNLAQFEVLGGEQLNVQGQLGWWATYRHVYREEYPLTQVSAAIIAPNGQHLVASGSCLSVTAEVYLPIFMEIVKSVRFQPDFGGDPALQRLHLLIESVVAAGIDKPGQEGATPLAKPAPKGQIAPLNLPPMREYSDSDLKLSLELPAAEEWQIRGSLRLPLLIYTPEQSGYRGLVAFAPLDVPSDPSLFLKRAYKELRRVYPVAQAGLVKALKQDGRVAATWRCERQVDKYQLVQTVTTIASRTGRGLLVVEVCTRRAAAEQEPILNHITRSIRFEGGELPALHPYTDRDLGLQLAIPEGWEALDTPYALLHLTEPGKSPHFRPFFSWNLLPLEATSPEQLTEWVQEQETNLAINSEEYTLGKAEQRLVDGQPAIVYEVETSEDGTAYSSLRVAVLDPTGWVYYGDAACLKATAHIYLPLFRSMLDTVQFLPDQSEQPRMHYYFDSDLQLQLKIPVEPGWQTLGNPDFTLLITPPDGSSYYDPYIGFNLQEVSAETPEILEQVAAYVEQYLTENNEDVEFGERQSGQVRGLPTLQTRLRLKFEEVEYQQTTLLILNPQRGQLLSVLASSPTGQADQIMPLLEYIAHSARF